MGRAGEPRPRGADITRLAPVDRVKSGLVRGLGYDMDVEW